MLCGPKIRSRPKLCIEKQVSVIIPTYNSQDTICRALDSVIAQTLQPFEIIVVDDGSVDNTISVIKEFSHQLKDDFLKLVELGCNSGPGRARNVGINISKGQLLAFLDSDDSWYPEKLEIAMKYFPEADIVYHDLDIYTPKTKRSLKGTRRRKLSSAPFVDLMVNGNALINSSVVVKKTIVNNVGGLSEDPSLVAAEDFDLWLKISRITDKFMYIPKSLGKYWMGDGNLSEISEKQISRVKALSNKHSSFLNIEDRKQHELRLNYIIGRLKQKMGSYDDALKLFKTSCKSCHWKLKLRSICHIMMIYMQRIKNV